MISSGYQSKCWTPFSTFLTTAKVSAIKIHTAIVVQIILCCNNIILFCVVLKYFVKCLAFYSAYKYYRAAFTFYNKSFRLCWVWNDLDTSLSILPCNSQLL